MERGEVHGRAHRRSARAAAVIVFFVASLTGCAAKSSVPDIFWPDPPDPPRIRYVGSLQSRDDVGGSSLRELLVGNDKTMALYQPMGIALSADGQRLYVVDRAWNLVFVFDRQRGGVRMIGDDERYPLLWPVGVALDAEENVYITDTGTRSVRVYDRDGHFLRGIGKEALARPTGIAIDAARHRLYVVDTGQNDSPEAHRVAVFDLAGDFLRAIGHRGSGDGEFNFPTFANLDAEGNLYVVDSVNNRIQIFDPDGNFVRTFGHSGDQIGDFARPKGVAVDTFGNIYVVDSRWSNVQIFNQEGQLLMIFGGVGDYPGLMMNPTAITIDNDNRIYVSDTLGKRVNIYQLVNTSAADSGETQSSLATPSAGKGG